MQITPALRISNRQIARQVPSGEPILIEARFGYADQAKYKLGGRISRHCVRTLSMKLRIPARLVSKRTIVSRMNPTFDHFQCPQDEINPTSGQLKSDRRALQLSSR